MLLTAVSAACAPERPVEPTLTAARSVAGTETGIGLATGVERSWISLSGTDSIRLGGTNQGRFELAIERQDSTRVAVELEPWLRRSASDTRLYPVRIELREDGMTEHLLSNGARRTVSLLDRVQVRGLDGRPDTYDDPQRPRLASAADGTSGERRGPRTAGTRLQVRVSPSNNAEALRLLTEEWGEPSRTGPTLLSFNRAEGGTTMRLTYDESVGAEVESELQSTAGVTTRIRSHYSPDGDGFRLEKTETFIMDQSGETLLTRTFGRSDSRGGVR